MRGQLIAVVALVLLAGGCSSLSAAEKVAPAGTVVREVEAFKLTDAKVEDLKGASGGKVVVMTTDAGEAELSVTLKKGAYELKVYGLAPSYDEDAFYLTVGDGEEKRLVISDINKVLPSAPYAFTVAKDGACRILITYGEDNVKFDKVVIAPAPAAKE